MPFVGKVNDVAPGQLLAVDMDGERVAIANVDGQFYAIGDVCTHRGCSLSEGEISGLTVICRCHGGQFELTSGEVVSGPPQQPVASYRVELAGDEFRIGQ
jgi:nitrite reductase/ring-hydroxylating ferredoxin subunit